jgi:AcrR family transcriptional regulator
VTAELEGVTGHVDATQEIDAVLPDLPQNAHRGLLIAGLELFCTQGFHGTSTRQIARLAGVSDAALYVYYSSKAALLLELAEAGNRSALRVVTAAMDEVAQQDPLSRLLAFVRAFTRWHAEHSALARVVQYELAAMEEPDRSAMVALRMKVVALVRTELTSGVESGVLDVDDVETTLVALMSLGIDVARWWPFGRGFEPISLGDRYATMAERMLRKADVTNKTSEEL